MRLDEDFATQMLQIPWQDWTPEQAEAVRRHFMGDWVDKAHLQDMTLYKSIFWAQTLHTSGPENEKLKDTAFLYCHYRLPPP